MAALISVTNFLNRADVVSVGRLCARGTSGTSGNSAQPLSLSALQTDTVLAAALTDASGLLVSACLQGDRYTETDLTNLTGNAQGAMYRFLARLAECLLWESRAMGSGDIPQPAFYELTYQDLERLKRGERVF